jgi:hypothetical protein
VTEISRRVGMFSKHASTSALTISALWTMLRISRGDDERYIRERSSLLHHCSCPEKLISRRLGTTSLSSNGPNGLLHDSNSSQDNLGIMTKAWPTARSIRPNSPKDKRVRLGHSWRMSKHSCNSSSSVDDCNSVSCDQGIFR